jgi:hypothetical protein
MSMSTVERIYLCAGPLFKLPVLPPLPVHLGNGVYERIPAVAYYKVEGEREIVWVTSRNEAFNFSGPEPRLLGMWEPESRRIYREVTVILEGADEEKMGEEEDEEEEVEYLGTVKAPEK